MAASEREEEEELCRICFVGREEGPLLSPCACRGSMHWVHASCIETWLRTRSPSRDAQGLADPLQGPVCDLCGQAFAVEHRRLSTSRCLACLCRRARDFCYAECPSSRGRFHVGLLGLGCSVALCLLCTLLSLGAEAWLAPAAASKALTGILVVDVLSLCVSLGCTMIMVPFVVGQLLLMLRQLSSSPTSGVGGRCACSLGNLAHGVSLAAALCCVLEGSCDAQLLIAPLCWFQAAVLSASLPPGRRAPVSLRRLAFVDMSTFAVRLRWRAEFVLTELLLFVGWAWSLSCAWVLLAAAAPALAVLCLNASVREDLRRAVRATGSVLFPAARAAAQNSTHQGYALLIAALVATIFFNVLLIGEACEETDNFRRDVDASSLRDVSLVSTTALFNICYGIAEQSGDGHLDDGLTPRATADAHDGVALAVALRELARIWQCFRALQVCLALHAVQLARGLRAAWGQHSEDDPRLWLLTCSLGVTVYIYAVGSFMIIGWKGPVYLAVLAWCGLLTLLALVVNWRPLLATYWQLRVSAGSISIAGRPPNQRPLLQTAES